MATPTPVAHVNVVLSGDLEARFQTIDRNLELQIAGDIEADMVASVPVDTGELRDSIKRTGNIIRVTAEHWSAVEYGTRPHVIMPKNKKALWWPEAAHPVPSVNHPGTKPQPYIRPASRKLRVPRPVSAYTIHGDGR